MEIEGQQANFEQEVKQSLREMGFTEKTITQAYSLSEIKTTEGVLNYIDAHPELQNSGAMEQETLPGNQEGQSQPQPNFGDTTAPRNPFDDDFEQNTNPNTQSNPE